MYESIHKKTHFHHVSYRIADSGDGGDRDRQISTRANQIKKQERKSCTDTGDEGDAHPCALYGEKRKTAKTQ